MPVLKDFRETKTVSLPNYPDSKIEIYSSLLVGDIDPDTSAENTLSFANSMKLLVKIIKSWNFTDENNLVLPVTEENLKLLNAKDFEFLATEISEFTKVVKKN